MKFVNLAKFGILEDFSVLYYIKVHTFVKLAKFGILEYFSCAILHKSHEIR